MDVAALRVAVARDRAAGLQPACVIATAGTVNTGAIDDLEAIADFCAEEGLWLHVDGCIGALLAIAPEGKALVRGIARADSIALDPHKWLHAPFEVGCALVRDADAHFGSFTLTPEYLESAPRGIASGAWLHDFGLQTSRGFRMRQPEADIRLPTAASIRSDRYAHRLVSCGDGALLWSRKSSRASSRMRTRRPIRTMPGSCARSIIA
jgi:hypothetical protein